MPIHISNVALVDGNGKASRVGIKLVDGKKVRYLKTTGTSLSA
jgi:large subunit ribosomal protein L24